MIFENDRITGLVVEWKRTQDREVLTKVLEGCKNLVDALSASYDPTYREDMKQEVYERIQYALEFYDPDISKLHSYLTSVIRNTCNTYANKVSKRKQHVVTLPDQTLDYVADDAPTDTSDQHILTGLVERNRQRFPNLPVDMLDQATEIVYYSIRDGVLGKSRGIVSTLMDTLDMPRNVATVLYHSSLVYLRVTLMEKSELEPPEYDQSMEYTLLPELCDLVGMEMCQTLVIVFSGMYMKFP